MNRARLALVSLIVPVSLFGAACGGDDETDANAAGTDGTDTTAASSTTASTADSGASMDMDMTPLRGEELDEAFVNGMVAHHQAAIDMATVEVEQGADPAAQTLAQSIIDAQQAEITELQGIAERLGFTIDDSMMSEPMGQMMGVPMPMAPDEMAAMLEGAPDVDMMFLEMMIPHHASAISMANEERNDGADAELIAIAERVIDDQAAEIGEMQAMLDAMG